MRLLLVPFAMIFTTSLFAQDIYTARKGSKFFPGHWDIAVSVYKDSARYEVFNHWYARAYDQVRQITLPLHTPNDSIKIEVKGNKIYLVDAGLKLNKKLRRDKDMPLDMMRKIAFASQVAHQQKDIKHFDLYRDPEDLALPEEEFKALVLANFALKLQK